MVHLSERFERALQWHKCESHTNDTNMNQTKHDTNDASCNNMSMFFIFVRSHKTSVPYNAALLETHENGELKAEKLSLSGLRAPHETAKIGAPGTRPFSLSE